MGVCGNVCCVAAVVKYSGFLSPGVLEVCCVFVSCVHHVAVLNAAFCMTFSLLMRVEDARGDHMAEAHSRAGLITALLVVMRVYFCLPHPVAVSTFMICSGLCACTEVLWMCVLYVSFGSKVRPITFGCVAMGSALLCILGPDCSYILQGLA